MPDEKIKTAFPGLQQANGVKPADMEVIKPEVQSGAGASAEGAVKPEEKQPEVKAGDESTPQPAATAKAEIDYDNLSEEDRDAMLAKLTKGKLKSLSSLDEPVKKSKEELEEEAEQRKQSALNFALSNGKVKKSDYDKAIRESGKSDRELVLALFTRELQEDDADITDEDAEDMFRLRYNEDLAPGQDDRLHKLGQKEISKLAANYRKEHFGFLDAIEPEYDNFISTQSAFNSYRGQIKEIGKELPKELTFSTEYEDVGGGKTPLEYKVPIDEKLMKKVLADFSSEETFGVLRGLAKNGEINTKALSVEMTNAIKAGMYDKMLPEILKQHEENVEQRTIVILGNKRNPNQPLNDGRQNTTGAEPKANTYPALNEATKNQRR